MEIKETFKKTPNISAKKIIPQGIVLHHTAGSYAGSVAWCLDKVSQVSYHCIVDLNGDRTVLADDNQRAWHSGVSSFQGRSDCNSWMLGIAVSGDTNNRELTDEEIKSVAEWCFLKMQKYDFCFNMITTHREVAPGRKTDISKRAEYEIKEAIKKLM